MTTAGDGSASKKQTPAFLEKLFDILEEESQFAELISWQPDGVSFIIKRVNEFSEIVLPKYFKHSNIQSYIRQLNMYGFSKTRHDSNHREFTHKLFRRGRRDLLPFIKRKTQSSTNRSISTVIAQSPNHSDSSFPTMSKIDRLPSSCDFNGETAEKGVISEGNTTGDADDYSMNMDLEQRVEVLESQLSFVLSGYHQLVVKHNELCNALNSQGFARQAAYDSFEREEHHSFDSARMSSYSNNRLLLTQHSESSNDKHVSSLTQASAVKKARIGEVSTAPSADQNCAVRSTVLHHLPCDLDKEMRGYFKKQQREMDFSYFRVSSSELQNDDPVKFEGNSVSKFDSFSSLKSTINRTTALTLSSGIEGNNPTNQQTEIPRSISIELGGLHAIATAAHILDSNATKDNSANNEQCSLTTNNLKEILLNRNKPAVKVLEQSSHTASQYGGQPLCKSFSFGPETTKMS